MQTMFDLGMPDYCTMRYTRPNGVKGLKFMSNDRLRGVDAYVTDSRDRSRRDYR